MPYFIDYLPDIGVRVVRSRCRAGGHVLDLQPGGTRAGTSADCRPLRVAASAPQLIPLSIAATSMPRSTRRRAANAAA